MPKITSNIPGEPVCVMVTDAQIESDSTLNATLPSALVGTIAHTAGYAKMKQKDLDGSWKPL